jgi:hypothetical protein
MTGKETLERLEDNGTNYLLSVKAFKIIKQDLDRLEILENQLKDGTLSDGYHTFNDLYYQRMYLFATIVNQNKEFAWKSLKHEDGELCFGGGWFIVGIDTPRGSYTYHYENKYWDLFNCKELEVAKHWDGHTSKDVDRLLSLKKDTQLEKELKQTKLNFRNSQTHSKNCYKKLKEKYTRLERAYKNNEVLVRDLNELINRNLELRKQIENLEEENQSVKDDNTRLWNGLEYGNNEISKLKQAIKILKTGSGFKVSKSISLDGTCNYLLDYKVGLINYGILLYEEQYELLKEVLESDR